MKKTKIIILIAVLMSLLVAIQLTLQTNHKKDNTENDLNEKRENIVEEKKHYRIVFDDNGYSYWILDAQGNVIKKDGPFGSKRPHISMVSEKLMKITIQAGTGMETQWGYYYDLETNVSSQIFQSIFDQSGDKMIYCTQDKVVIRHMFDERKYYTEISDFKEDFSVVTFPFVEVKFLNNGTSISVSYMSGEHYQVVTEEIVLP